MSVTGPTPTPPIDPEDLAAERAASAATLAAEISALGEAMARLHEAERSKTPAPNEYENAKKLADLNDRATRVLLARVRPLLEPGPETTSVEEIEGIGPAYADKLKAAGVESVETLLTAGATPSGRKHLLEKSGISSKLILRWVNHADLFRIPGVAGEYAELLEVAGVDSVPELGQRDAAKLAATLTDTNAKHEVVRRLPTLVELESWTATARSLPRIVQH